MMRSSTLVPIILSCAGVAVAACSGRDVQPSGEPLPPAVADEPPARAHDLATAAFAADAGREAASPPDAGAPSVPDEAPLCRRDATWLAPKPALAGLGETSLVTVTPDELDAAWVTGVEGAVTIRYAHRESTADAFGAARALAGAYALDRVALTSDGLGLYVLAADRRHGLSLSRASRDEDFEGEVTGPFANVDADAADATLADLVLSPDDRTLYYSKLGGAQTVHVSYRLFANDAWPAGHPIASRPELDATAGGRRRPMAVSADLKTLFFWDEVAGASRAAWIDRSPDAFVSFVTLGATTFAAPNLACDRLYVARDEGGSTTLEIVDRQ